MTDLRPLFTAEVDALRQHEPALPSDYIQHMAEVGWGTCPNGRILYSGPVHPADIYGDRLADSHILLLGDDMCGFCFGYDPDSQTYGEFSDDGEWQAWPADRRFLDYVANDGDA